MFENLINYCSSFIALSAIDKEALALNFKHITIKRNDFLLKEGKVCDFIAFVNSGVIRHYHLKDGKEITCDVTLKNSFITDFKSFTQGIPSEYNFQILKNTELFVIKKKNY
jgi:CRP-like cAMP-binding protein